MPPNARPRMAGPVFLEANHVPPWTAYMARPAGVEPATTSLEGWCSIHLSYGRSNAHYSRCTPNTQFLNMVGVEGFEPTTPCSQSRCATRLRYTPSGTHARRRFRKPPRRTLAKSAWPGRREAGTIRTAPGTVNLACLNYRPKVRQKCDGCAWRAAVARAMMRRAHASAPRLKKL